MEDQKQANLVGLALAHGVVNLANIRQAAASEEPDLLKALVNLGFMDVEDVEALEQSLERHVSTSGSGGNEPTGDHPSSQGRSASDPAPDLLWAVASGPKAPTPAPGQQVLSALALPTWKHYRNLRFLAEGGMGRIFKAYDPTLKRVVALKFLNRDAPDMVQRFLLEAQHQGSLDHPNICKVYEVGEWQGQAYLAMQYLPGETLEAVADTLPLREKVQIMETVAEAIHAAHRQGLIHRDLKPGNIQIRRGDDQSPKPYVLDFGLARGVLDSGLTMEGMVLGTLHYMAPEQTRGDLDGIGRQTDVYGLGATLYRLLAGAPPFAGVEGLEAIQAASEGEVEPLRKFAPNLPADLETIVMKCLEKEPSRRYPTARELAEDLRRFLDDEPIRARTPTLAYRIAKWQRKHQALVALGGGSLALLLLLGAWGIQTKLHATAQARWAQHFGQHAERMEAQLRYAHLLPLHDLTQERQAAEATLGNMTAELRKAGTMAAGPGHYAQGSGYLALGETDRAKRLLEQAWREGFRAPEVSYAYGRVLGLVYQRELEKARGIALPELRVARVQDLKRLYREPALKHLHAGAFVDPTGFPEALIAFYDGSLDEALGKARQVFQARPWFYEAKRLEGEILLAKARALQDPAKILAALAPATEAFLAAQRVAPSDASLCLGEAHAWREAIVQQYATGADPSPALEACRAATRKAATLAPRTAEPSAVLAQAIEAWARQTQNRGIDTSSSMDEALSLAEQALAWEPLNREAHAAKAMVTSAQGYFLREASMDPRPKLRQAVSECRWALEQDPGDTQASDLACRALTWIMSYEIYAGIEPWTTFEEMLGLNLRLLRQHPDQPIIHRSLGYAWGERAEFERRSGLDPESSCARSLQAFQVVLASNPADFRAQYGSGNAHLMKAQQACATGGNPSPEATLAIQCYERALTINPNFFMTFGTLGETHLVLAQAALDENKDPNPALDRAESWLKRGLAENQRSAFLRVRLGQVRLLRARWAQATGSVSQADLQRAIEAFRAALTESPGFGEAMAGLAECHLLRLSLPGVPWQAEVVQGEAWITKALATNDKDAEFHLLAGILGVLKARHSGTARDAEQAQASLQAALRLNRNLARQAAPYLRGS